MARGVYFQSMRFNIHLFKRLSSDKSVLLTTIIFFIYFFFFTKYCSCIGDIYGDVHYGPECVGEICQNKLFFVLGLIGLPWFIGFLILLIPVGFPLELIGVSDSSVEAIIRVLVLIILIPYFYFIAFLLTHALRFLIKKFFS